MTPLVWANFPLALLFILAIVGIPGWMIYKRVDEQQPDYSEAHAYLRAKAETERTTGLGTPEPAQVTTMAAAASPPTRRQGRWHTSRRRIVAGRRPSGRRTVRVRGRQTAPAGRGRSDS